MSLSPHPYSPPRSAPGLPFPPNAIRLELDSELLGVSALLGLTAQVLSAAVAPFLAFFAIAFIPAELAKLVYPMPTVFFQGSSLQAFFVHTAITIVPGTIAAIGITRLVESVAEGRRLEYGEALARAIELTPRYLVATIVICAGWYVLTLMLIVPGVMFGGYAVFAWNFVCLRNEGIIGSVTESYRLVKGRWWSVIWRCFGVMFILSCGGAALYAATTYVGARLLSPPTVDVLNTLWLTIYSFVICVAFTLFFLSAETTQRPTARLF